jgi:predicted transcriptional regulator YdeE
VKVENQDSFTVVGLTVRTNNAAEAGGQGKIRALWEGAMNNGQLQQVPNQAGDGFVVVYTDYASDHTGDYNYTLGVRVSSADQVPAGFVVRKIEAGRYAVIQSQTGPPEQVTPALWQHINALTPQQLGGTRAYETDFETYPNITDWGSVQIAAHLGLKKTGGGL